MTSTKQQTAAEAYAARLRECDELVESTRNQLQVHAARQQGDPKNWGFAGDLGYVIEQLSYVLASLGDRSAVERNGFKY